MTYELGESAEGVPRFPHDFAIHGRPRTRSRRAERV